MGEIYGCYERDFRNNGASFNLGFRRRLTEHAALIGAAGRGLFGDADRAPAFQSYLAIQWTLRERPSQVLKLERGCNYGRVFLPFAGETASMKAVWNYFALALLVLAAVPATAAEVALSVRADHDVGPVSRLLTGACIEDVNHEIYGGIYSQMIFGESFQEPPSPSNGVSAMWRPTRRGTASGGFAIISEKPFVGAQSQKITFDEGEGDWGLENEGLNHWGMNFVAGQPYEGCLWARAEKRTEVVVALESRDGARVYAETSLTVDGEGWQRLSFNLTPSAADHNGRFALRLRRPGAVTLGYAFLQPGEWGRFKGLPVRRDVAEGLIGQGITVLRYGGSMVNNDGYRWKKMIGRRDERPPYAGTWYRYSSDGWGIVDFMDFCEAAGFEYVPAFNMGESPQDMADFIEYAKDAPDTDWGRRRVADGHPQPYHLQYLELGNEERVDARYADKFEALAKAIWAKDPSIIPVAGDFAYGKQIIDPWQFTGAASGLTNLAGHQRILQLAKALDREVWFDVHVDTEHPVLGNTSLDGMFSFYDALDQLAGGARHKVVVFELNAGNHAQKRALANAQAILAIERDGRLPITTSANGLQPDGQNENGWDQGLLFLNPSQVWLQPPGYVTQMLSQNYQPQRVLCEVTTTGAPVPLDVCATRSADGKTLVLQTVNPGESAVTAEIHLSGFTPGAAAAQVTELSGPLEAVNKATQPQAIVPKQSAWPLGKDNGSYSFPPHSVTVMRFE
jgi:alpha-L-arabinofuranosidase